MSVALEEKALYTFFYFNFANKIGNLATGCEIVRVGGVKDRKRERELTVQRCLTRLINCA